MDGSSSSGGNGTGGPPKLSLKFKLGAPRPPPPQPSLSTASHDDDTSVSSSNVSVRTNTQASSTTLPSSRSTVGSYDHPSSSITSSSMSSESTNTTTDPSSSSSSSATTAPKLKLTLFKKPESTSTSSSSTVNTTGTANVPNPPILPPSSIPSFPSLPSSSSTHTLSSSSSGYLPISSSTPTVLSPLPPSVSVPSETASSSSAPTFSSSMATVPSTREPLPPLSTKLTGIHSVDEALRNLALAETGYRNRSVTRSLLKSTQIPIAILKLYFDPDMNNYPPLNAPIDIDTFHTLQRWPGDERGSTELSYHLQNATYIRSNEVQENAVPSMYDIYHINATNDVQSTTYGSLYTRKVRILDNYSFVDEEGLPINLFTLLLNQVSSSSPPLANGNKSIQVFGTVVAGMQTCPGIRGRPTYPSIWRDGLQNIRKASIIGLRDQLKELIEINMSGSTVRRYATGNMVSEGVNEDDASTTAPHVPMRRTVGATFNGSKLQLPPIPPGVKLTREDCHERAKNLVNEAQFPLQLTSQLTIESLGSISTRKGYHTERYIWPIGFRSVRLFTDILDPENRAPYTCEILDGGDNGPLFRVTYNNNMAWTGRTPTAAWTLLNEKLTETKRKLAGDDTVTAQRILSGPDLFGFAGSKAGNLIEGLPDALECTRYNFLEIREPDVRKRKIVDVDNENDNDQPTPSANNTGNATSSATITAATTSSSSSSSSSSQTSASVDSNAPKAVLVFKRPKFESFEGKLYATIRDIVREDMGEDNEGGLSMKEVRRRAEIALECDLTEKREVIRTMVEKVLKEMDEAKDNESETNTETEDDDSTNYADPGNANGGRKKPVKRRRNTGNAPATPSTTGPASASLNTSTTSTATNVASNKAFTFLASPPDEESECWPRGTSRQRLRIHIPSIRGIEIIFSGTLVDQFQGLPVLILRGNDTDYILATPESDVSPSRPCRSGARKLLHFYECCVSTVYALRKQTSMLLPFNYTQIVNTLDTYGHQRTDYEFNSNDIRGSGLYADEDGVVKWADYLSVILNGLPERTVPRALRETFLNTILLQNRLNQIDELKHYLRTLLHLAETVIITGKREAELECFRVLGMDTADAIAFMRNVPVPDNLEADDDSRIVSRYNQAKEKKNTSIIDQKKLVRPLPSAIFDPALISSVQGEAILAAWGFIQTFSTTLNLLPYRLDDLAAALLYSVGDSALVSQTFIALLKLITDERIMNDDLRIAGGGEFEDTFGSSGNYDDYGASSAYRTGTTTAAPRPTANVGNRGYGGISSPPNTGTWQEYLRLIIENSLSDREKGQVHTRVTEILLYQQLKDTNAMKIDDSVANVTGPLPALGMILELCARRLDALIYENNSSLLLTAPLDITLNPRFPDISASWIDLSAIRKRLLTGYYGTATDAEEALLQLTLQQPSPSAENGGVQCGSVPGSGYKGFIADIRTLVANCRYLGIVETTSYGSALGLFSTNFETKLENEILPFAGRLAGNLKAKELYQLRRFGTAKGLSSRDTVTVNTETGTAASSTNSVSLSSSTVSPLDILLTQSDSYSLTDICVLLRMMEFKFLPLGAKVTALRWCTDETACTARIRGMIDKNEETLTEAWQEAKRARDNYISFARKIDSWNYKQLVAKYFLDRLQTVDNVRTKGLYDEVHRYAALLRSRTEDTKLVQLLASLAITSSTSANPFPDIVKTLTTEVVQDNDESQQSIQTSRIQLANAYRSLLSCSTRMLPIGYDRDHRRYWIMNDLGETQPFVEEENDSNELIPSSTLHSFFTNPRTTLRIFVEEVKDYASEQLTESAQPRVLSTANLVPVNGLPSNLYDLDLSTTFGTIQAYPTIASINQLLDWLMPNGIRERDTWGTVHALSNQLRKRLLFARYDMLVYRELLGLFVGNPSPSKFMNEFLFVERRKVYENSVVHCSTTVMPDARSVAIQLLKTIVPSIHDTDKMAMTNKRSWRSTVVPSASVSLLQSEDTEANGSSLGPAASGLAYAPHSSDDYPFCVYCGSIVSVRWYYVTLDNKTVTAFHSNHKVTANGTVPERLCGSCFSYARSHHWTLRNLSHSDQAVTAIAFRAIGPILEKAKGGSVVVSPGTATSNSGDDNVSINPVDNSYAIHLLDTVYVPRTTNHTGKAAPLTLRLGSNDRKNSVSMIDQEWIHLRKLLPLFAHYYSPTTETDKWNDYNYLQTNIPIPEATVSSSLFASYYDTVTALQVRLLQVEARLCHPKILPEWRYGRRRHEWRVQVATLMVPKNDLLHECMTIIKNAIQSCLQSSLIHSLTEEKPNNTNVDVSPATLQLHITQAFNSCRNHVTELLQRTVRTCSRLLLELEEMVHTSHLNKRTALGIVRESWEEYRFEWCRDVQYAYTLSALYVAAERLEDRAIEWEGIMDSVSELERSTFLRITYEKGGGLPSSLVLENTPGVIATNTPLTSRGSNTLTGSSSIAYIPNEGEDVMYYGEGYAEAIQIAREYAAEAAAQREKQLHSMAIGRGMGTRRGDDKGSSSVSSSSFGLNPSNTSSNDANALRKTCSDIMAPMMPVPGTALAKVLKVTYHSGGDTEPYAKIQLGINRWLHASVATLETPNLTDYVKHHAQFIDNTFLTDGTDTKRTGEYEVLFARALEENYILPLAGVQIHETEAGPGHGVPALAIQETTCSICGGGAQISCSFDRCGRAYCGRCLSLNVIPPSYVCPVHYCGMCRIPLASSVPVLRPGTNTGVSCVACATSYCIDCFDSHCLPANGAPQRAGTTAPVNGGCVWENSPVPSPYGTWRCTTCSMPVRRLLSVFRRALSAMRNHPDSGPFRQPMDTNTYPDYFTVIKKPIDIQSMETKLAEGRYPSLISFLEDCRLLMDNCDTYCENRFQNLPPAARSVVYAGLRQLAHPYTLEQIRNAELDYVISQRGGTLTDTTYGIAGQISRKDRHASFTDAAGYLNYRYRKALKEWVVKHPEQTELCSPALGATQASATANVPMNDSTTSSSSDNEPVWQRNSAVPIEDFVSAVLLLARRARSEALANGEIELARIRAARVARAQTILEQDEETKRVIQDAATKQAKAAADAWLHSQPARIQSSYHTGFPEYVEKYNTIRDSTYSVKLTELRATTLNHMLENTYYTATEQASLYKMYLERAQFLHPAQENLITDLENDFGPGAVPGYAPPTIKPNATVSTPSPNASASSASVLDAYVQTFTVIVRLQALTSDFLVPLDRYVAAVGQKWSLRTEFATWRLTAPEGLIQSSGLQYGLHAAAVQRAITLTDQHYRTPGKFYEKNHSATVRKNMMNIFHNILQTAKHSVESNRPVVKLGKIYTGKVIGCVMMDTLTDTLALQTAFKSGLVNPYEAALRLCAVPWRCLTVRWYDLRYSKGSSTNYENIWESASLSSISRVNPWESMDTLDTPRTIDPTVLPSIGPPYPGLPALWDIGIRNLLYLPNEHQTGDIRPLPFQITYVPETQPVPPYLIIPPTSIPPNPVIPTLTVGGGTSSLLPAATTTATVGPTVAVTTTSTTTATAVPVTVPTVPKPPSGPVSIVIPSTGSTANTASTVNMTAPTTAAVTTGMNVTLQVLQNVAAGRASLPGVTPIMAANLLSVPALAQHYLLRIQDIVNRANAQGASGAANLGSGMMIIALQTQQMLQKYKQQPPQQGATTVGPITTTTGTTGGPTILPPTIPPHQ